MLYYQHYQEGVYLPTLNLEQGNFHVLVNSATQASLWPVDKAPPFCSDRAPGQGTGPLPEALPKAQVLP